MSRTLALALALVLLAACSSQRSHGTAAENTGSPGQPLAGTQPAQPTEPESPTAPPATQPPDTVQPTPIAGSLAVSDGAGGMGPFRIGAVSRLQLEGSCSSAPPGPHTLRLDVVSPSGTVYASVPEDVIVSDSGTAAVSRALQVRGSTIEAFLRAGTWHFTLTMDGGDPLASADVDLTE